MTGSSKFELSRHRTIELRGSEVRTGIEPVKQGMSLKSLARMVLSSQFDSNSVSNEPRTDQFDERVKMTPPVRTEVRPVEVGSNIDVPDGALQIAAVKKPEPPQEASTTTPFNEAEMGRSQAGRDWAPATMQEKKPATLGTSKTTEVDIANFYRKLFHGQSPVAAVTLDDRAVEEAIRLGLLDAAGGQVILAYRNLQAQALIKIPADRYDGLAILRLVSEG